MEERHKGYVTVVLTRSEADHLRALAREEDRSVSYVTRRLLRAVLRTEAGRAATAPE